MQYAIVVTIVLDTGLVIEHNAAPQFGISNAKIIRKAAIQAMIYKNVLIYTHCYRVEPIAVLKYPLDWDE